MTEASDQIKAKLVSNGHTTKCFDPDKFIKSTDVLNGQNFRFDFQDGYELWYYGTEDKITAYKGFIHIFSIYSQDIKTETMDYVNFLKTAPAGTGVATSSKSSISDSLYCECSKPTIEKRLMIVNYFDFCTTCKKEYQKKYSSTSWFLNY